MSQENVEIAQRIVDAINRRDSHAWAAVVALEFEFRSASVGIEGRPHRGPEAGRRYFADLAEAWDNFHLQVVDVERSGCGQQGQ
jgi:hypothetical protein